MQRGHGRDVVGDLGSVQESAAASCTPTLLQTTGTILLMAGM